MKKNRFFCAVVSILMIFWAAAAFAQDEFNVVLIVVSALRYDHLGCYGYRSDISPNIDSLARDSVVFDNALTQSYWTLPGVASLFTSRYVCSHGVDSRDKKLNQEEITLAGVLRSQGYKTAAFTSGLDLVEKYGLDNGFETYYAYKGSNILGSFADIMPRAVRWLDRESDKKFFLFLHSYDVHPPYRQAGADALGREYRGALKHIRLDYRNFKEIYDGFFHLEGKKIPLNADDVDYIISRYDNCITYMDHFVGDLVDDLKKRKIYDKTMIILCADHGEELGERNTFNRFGSRNLYQEVIRVPLIIKFPGPGIQPRRVDALVGLVDVMPTILAQARIGAGLDAQGKSLIPLLQGGIDPQPRSFMIAEASSRQWAMVSSDRWKLIVRPDRSEMYDLNSDPGEKFNVIERNLQRRVSMMQSFMSWYASHQKRTGTDNRLKLDSRLIENLKKTGYW